MGLGWGTVVGKGTLLVRTTAGGQGGDEVAEACHFLSKSLVFRGVCAGTGVGDGGNGGRGYLHDLVGHVGELEKVHRVVG